MKKDKLINVIAMVAISSITIGIIVYASDYLFASNIVSYDNSTSGIRSSNVQGAIDELYACASDYNAYNTRLTNVESQIYPVGSIYISVSNTNPSTLFGGIWQAFGNGRTLVGIDTSDTDFSTVEKTGGSKTHQHLIPIGWDSNKVLYAYGANPYYNSTVINGVTRQIAPDIFTTQSNQPVRLAFTDTRSSLQPYISVYMWKRTA